MKCNFNCIRATKTLTTARLIFLQPTKYNTKQAFTDIQISMYLLTSVQVKMVS